MEVFNGSEFLVVVWEFEADPDVFIEVVFPVFEVFSKQFNGSVISLQQTDNDFLGGAFSCTVRTEESEDFTSLYMK